MLGKAAEQKIPGICLPIWTTTKQIESTLHKYFRTLESTEGLQFLKEDLDSKLQLLYINFSS